MFYQNSNDLVKHASAKSGHVQNSKETSRRLITETQPCHIIDADTHVNFDDNNSMSSQQHSSLSIIGAQFQNMLQGLFSTPIKEGLEGAGGGGGVAPANPSSGGIGGTSGPNQDARINGIAAEHKQYTREAIDHNTKVGTIISLIEKKDINRRNKWAEVTDSAGVTKYGYITRDGVFQIWHAPTSPSSNPPNWLETDTVKQNMGVIGCPAQSGPIQKIKIAETWNTIKPYDLIYADTDTKKTNPLFIIINDSVRDSKNTPGGRRLFSCGNERGNVYIGERPSADFQLDDPDIKTGCYVIADNVTDVDLTNHGFMFQDDLHEASISQCKRRAEDLGSSYFLISAPPDKDNHNNRGGCWIYAGSGKPNIDGILTLNNDNTKCHTVGNVEDDEDGYMKAYTTTNLKRMYGKNHIGSSSAYNSKGDGMWIGEKPDEYTCSGANGRKTNGPDGGEYDRYCVFDKGEDAATWCSSDPTCQGIVQSPIYEQTKRLFIATKKPVVGSYAGTWYFEKSATSTKSQAVALYSLKSGGPNGVDKTDQNGRGMLGRIAYIDHNGERHDYPESALSFMAPSKNAAGETLPASYINLGGYDTRSAESSYGLKEITPGSFSEASNLLYKASRDGWSPAAFHQRCDNKGATYTRAIINDGRVLGAYTSVSWSSTNNDFQNDTTAFLYDGTSKFSTENNSSGPGNKAIITHKDFYPTFGEMGDFYIQGRSLYSYTYTFITSYGKGPFGKNKDTRGDYTLQDIEVYSVDANTFPKTNPPDYARRLRTMPVGDSITVSMEKCRGICDADEKCGGFVYTKSGTSADGKCELKDRAKMYPVGLRVADQTKQLMLKVPTINGTIADDKCKVGNGTYTTIDSAQYQHYPDTGMMISGSKCDIRELIPKDGTLKPTDLALMYGSVTKGFEEIESKIAEYRAQTTIAPPPKATTGAEGFGVLREGIDNYATTMSDVADDLKNIANSEYQRERLLAITEETNKLLMAESYKFILWSVLAILAVLAVLKLKEMFGEDDADDGGDGGSGGGLLATILGWFGVGSMKTDDIPDRTEDVKAALSSAGAQMKEAGTNLATGVTEGADNLVNSANDAATGAIEGANNLVDKAKEAASGAIDKIGAAATSATTTSVQPPSAPTTGGKRHFMKTKRTK